VRAPALLVFTAAGVGACAGGRNDLLGVLLSDALEVQDPYRDGDTPAAMVLKASLMYPNNSWPAKRLREYLKTALDDDAWRGSTFDRAWERWQYLVGVASTYYSEQLKVTGGERLPYLRIEDAGSGRPSRTTAGKAIRKQVQLAGDEHPLLNKGFCGGSAELFETAAETFDNRYGEWGNNLDWEALPGGGGILPSGPHHPGEGPT
jgi:hypothetical protein